MQGRFMGGLFRGFEPRGFCLVETEQRAQQIYWTLNCPNGRSKAVIIFLLQKKMGKIVLLIKKSKLYALTCNSDVKIQIL